MVRRSIRRGTVQFNLRIDRKATADDYVINTDVLLGYQSQLDEYHGKSNSNDSTRLDSLLLLPGVVEERSRRDLDPHKDWPLIEPVAHRAITAVAKMRAVEGAAMASDLTSQCDIVSSCLDAIAERAPSVSESYRNRLSERVNRILEQYEVTVQPSDLIREVSLFADRSDISEEIVRLRSHQQQFLKSIQLPDSAGRKLEFIAQEMGREVNTIGSKANDAEISRRVVDIKAALERIREQVQNVE